MSNFNFINRNHTCQKGFLLLEALVTLCALAALLLALASWYGTAVTSQRTIHERLQAMSAAASYIAECHSMRKLPSAGRFLHGGYALHLTVQPDRHQPHFHWFKVTALHAENDTAPGKQQKILAELVSGMQSAGAAS